MLSSSQQLSQDTLMDQTDPVKSSNSPADPETLGDVKKQTWYIPPPNYPAGTPTVDIIIAIAATRDHFLCESFMSLDGAQKHFNVWEETMTEKQPVIVSFIGTSKYLSYTHFKMWRKGLRSEFKRNRKELLKRLAKEDEKIQEQLQSMFSDGWTEKWKKMKNGEPLTDADQDIIRRKMGSSSSSSSSCTIQHLGASEKTVEHVIM